MENKFDDQLLVIKALVDINKQVTNKLKDSDKIKNKRNNHDFELYKIKKLLNKFIGNNQTSYPDNMDSPKA